MCSFVEGDLGFYQPKMLYLIPTKIYAAIARQHLIHVKGGIPGLVVMGGDSCSEGREFESQHHILDGLLKIFNTRLTIGPIWLFIFY